MRRIAVVGAGQVGLHLGIGLARRGYEVRMLSNRTGEQIRNGSVLSSQAMMAPTLDLERAEGLEMWELTAPHINGIHLTWLDDNGQEVTHFSARRARPALSVDQRVKMPVWMEIFEQSGGTLEIVDADAQTLEKLTENSELVVVASGKGDISALFEVDTGRVEFTKPQRHLTLAYLNGVEPHAMFEGNDFGKHDGIGEMFMFPAMTVTGPCHIITIEAVPGSALDVFQPGQSADELVAQIKDVAGDAFPWLASRLKSARPTDLQATLVGRFAPTPRNPVAQLSNGASVLGAGDVVTLNDPLTGQGSNNAARCAASYLASIIENGDAPFTPKWMRQTASRFIAATESSALWTNATLRPWPEHVRELLSRAAYEPRLAQLFVEGFADPNSAWAWWRDPREAAALAMNTVTAKSDRRR